MSAVVTRPTGVRTKSTLKERWANFVFEVKKNKISYLFLAPFMTLFFVFTVLPVLLSIVLSFTYFNMLEWPTWIGWTNYVRLFLADDIFLIAVQNTLVFAAITGPASYMLCLLFAWFINELQPKLRAFLTLLFYAPSISANAYMVWQIMFSGDSEVILTDNCSIGVLLKDQFSGWLTRHT